MHELRVKDPDRDERVRDAVDDASEDSFPASDPPSWIGTRIGGPPRGPAAPNARPRASDDGPAPAAEPAGHVFDRQWIAGQWSDVRLCSAEIVRSLRHASGPRAKVRAVVQLGALTPADVRVTARSIVTDIRRGTIQSLRLWSVWSLHNGAFVFEASDADARAIDRPTDFVVTVEPARAGPGGRLVARALRLVAPSQADGGATSSRT